MDSTGKYGPFGLILLFSVFMILCGSHSSGATERKPLTWGTTASTSGVFTYFVAAAKILNEKIPEINVTVRATGGGVQNTRLVEKSQVDIGGADTSTTWAAVQGKGAFEGTPFPDLRFLFVSMTNPLQFVVLEKSGVKEIRELEGKLFTPGMAGGSAERLSMDIFRILGVHPQIRYSSYADAIEAMKDERIVGFAKHGVPDSSILEVASAKKIRILSLSDADLDKIVRSVPGQRKTRVAAGIYPGVGEFGTVENEWTEFVRRDFPATLAYKIVRTIWENRQEIKQANRVFVGDRLVEASLGVKTNYLHPGAVQFFRELGLTVPKILIPPEMKE